MLPLVSRVLPNNTVAGTKDTGFLFHRNDRAASSMRLKCNENTTK